MEFEMKGESTEYCVYEMVGIFQGGLKILGKRNIKVFELSSQTLSLFQSVSIQYKSILFEESCRIPIFPMPFVTNDIWPGKIVSIPLT